MAGAGLLASAASPSRMQVVTTDGTTKDYAVSELKNISFASVDGDVAADIEILAYSKYGVKVNITPTPGCKYYMFALLPKADADRIADSPAQTAAYLRSINHDVYTEALADHLISQPLESGEHYSVISIGVDAYDIDGDVRKNSFIAEGKIVNSTDVNGPVWSDGGNHDIFSEKETYDYGTPKIGDYYYSDGSWSDGGYLGRNDNEPGSVNWTSPRPAPVPVNPYTGKQRTVIGIVFTTDVDRMGAGERDAVRAKGYRPHGLVIATKPCVATQWDRSAHDEAVIGIANVRGDENTPLYGLINETLNGYTVCSKIASERASELSSYLCLSDVAKLDAPEESTGWFVPSTGQWLDMLRNLTGYLFDDTVDYYFPFNEMYPLDGLHCDWQFDINIKFMEKYPTEDIIGHLNMAFDGIDSSYKTDFAAGDSYILSTFADSNNMYYTTMMPKFTCIKAVSKAYWIKARPILAF